MHKIFVDYSEWLYVVLRKVLLPRCIMFFKLSLQMVNSSKMEGQWSVMDFLSRMLIFIQAPCLCLNGLPERYRLPHFIPTGYCNMVQVGKNSGKQLGNGQCAVRGNDTQVADKI